MRDFRFLAAPSALFFAASTFFASGAFVFDFLSIALL
jgi:hypothetical protein